MNPFSKSKKTIQPTSTQSFQNWAETHAQSLYPPLSADTAQLLVAIKECFGEHLGNPEVEELMLAEAIAFWGQSNKGLIKLLQPSHYEALIILPRPACWKFILCQLPKNAATLDETELHRLLSDTPSIKNLSSDKLIEQLADKWLIISNESKPEAILPSGRYVEPLSPRISLWQRQQLKSLDPMLLWLSIDKVTAHPNHTEIPKSNKRSYYWASSQKSGLAILDKQGNIRSFPLEGKVSAKSKIGKDPVSQGSWAWKASLKNEHLYQEAMAFLNETDSLERIRECARLNWLKDPKDLNSNDYAFELLRMLQKTAGNPLDDLALFFLSITDEKRQYALTEENTDEELLNHIQEALTGRGKQQELPQWVEKWGISPEGASSLLSAFLSLRKNEGTHLLPLHWWIRERFLDKQPKLKKYSNWDKSLLQRLNFEFEYLKHAIACGSHNDALNIAQELYASLPEENPQDLIPDAHLDDAPPKRQTYRIQLLEILVSAKQKDPSRLLELKQLAMLEPMNLSRLRKLHHLADGALKERVSHCMALLSAHRFILQKYDAEHLPNAPLSAESLDSIQALISSDLTGKLQSWLASAKGPELSQVRAYSEQVTPANDHAELLKKIASIQRMLKMPPVDCYISRGEKAGEVRAHEGKHPFILIGQQLIDSESLRCLGNSGLLFLIGSEMSHIKLKHVKLTSQDVWRGSLEKGATVVQMIPMLGEAFKALSIPLNKLPLSPIIQKSGQTFQQLGDMGLFEYAQAHWESYVDTPQGQGSESYLLEISQLMQFVADRVGLVASADIRGAIQALFYGHDDYFKNVPFIESYGIASLTQQEDGRGHSAYKLLSRRIASLISFYLSDTYQQAREEVLQMDE